MAENENGAASEFATKDNAYTFGGPIFTDRAWFFGSYRYQNREDDVVTLDTREFMRTVDNTQHQGFAKGTWAPTNDDLLTFTYLSDPTKISGRREQDITNPRDRSREQGGHRYGATYQRLWNAATFEFGINKHNGEVSDFSVIREPANEILFQQSDVRVLTDEQLGGYGRDLVDQRDNLGVRGNLTYLFGNHQIKGGIEWRKHHRDRRLDRQLEPPGVRREQHQRFRRADRHDQRASGSRAFLRGVRRQRRRNDHLRRDGLEARVQQHGGQPERRGQL
jgi:hypothetical protein